MPAISSAFAQGTHAARPAASSANSGWQYFETDTNGGTLYQSNGSSWVQIGAPVNALTSPLTTKGDLIVGGTAGATNRLGVGTDGQQLMADSTQTLGIKWATVPAVRAYNSANISTSSGSFAYLTFDSERFDQGTATEQHSTATNTGRLVCQQAGLYQIGGNVRIAGSAGGSQRGLQIRLNGATPIAQAVTAPESTLNVDVIISTLYSLAAGDYVELGSYQDSGGSLNVVAVGNYSPEFYWARAG